MVYEPIHQMMASMYTDMVKDGRFNCEVINDEVKNQRDA
jgi:hypothetical protein